MINFQTSSLKKEFSEAIKILSFLDGEIDGIPLECFIDDEIDEDDDYEIIVHENTVIDLHIGDDEYPSIEVKHFIDMANNKSKSEISKNYNYAKSDKEVYFLLEINDYDTTLILGNTFSDNHLLPISKLEKEVVYNGEAYSLSIFKGFSIFNLLLEERGICDEFFPSYSSYDYFVRIKSKDKIKMDNADDLVNSYIFELQTTFDIYLSISNGRSENLTSVRGNTSLEGMQSKMLPLITGIGTSELIDLYNTARNTFDNDFKILGLIKVIEFISPTIAKKKLIEDVSYKLNTPNVLDPNASYIMELGEIFSKYNNDLNKDKELIKLTILTIITTNDIWDTTPDFIRGKQAKKPENSVKEQEFLMKISECVYSTRNEIAHAKANYKKIGIECPRNYKNEFCKLLNVIAIRCIRWFSMQPDEKKLFWSSELRDK